MGGHTNIPAFGEDYAEEEEEEEGGGADPAIGDIGSGFVKVCLISLRWWNWVSHRNPLGTAVEGRQRKIAKELAYSRESGCLRRHG